MFQHFLKTAFRNLTKKGTFNAINILGLSIGMAASLMISYYVIYENSYDDFRTESEDIFQLHLIRSTNGQKIASTVLPMGIQGSFQEMNEINSSFRLLNVDYQNNSFIYKSNSGTRVFEENNVYITDPEIESVLDLKLTSGSFTAFDQPNKIILSNTLSEKLFEEEDPIGKVLTISSNIGSFDFEVIGVLDRQADNSNFYFESLISMNTLPGIEGPDVLDRWVGWRTRVYLRKENDVSEASLLSSIEANFFDKPVFQNPEESWQAGVQNISDIHLKELQEDGTISYTSQNLINGLAIIGVFILIIAWINYINLATVRAIERAKEVGVRKVLGAVNTQLRTQFVLESLVINIVASIFAVLLFQLFKPLTFFTANTEFIPESTMIQFGALAFLIVALGTLLSGMYPAFVLSSFKPSRVISGAVDGKTKGDRLRKSLVVFQFIISIAMIAGTFIVYQQINYMKNRDLGFSSLGMLILNPPPVSLVGNNEFRSAVNSFKEEVIKLPGVYSMSASSSIPGEEISWYGAIDRKSSDSEVDRYIRMIASDRDFDKTFGIDLAAGRFYQEGDNTWSKGEIVINESALEYFDFTSADDAIGKKLDEKGNMFPELTVIGVLNDYHHKSLKEQVEPVAFVLSAWANHYAINLELSNDLAPADRAKELKQTMSSIEEQWSRFFPETPFDYYFLDDRFDAQYRDDVRFGTIFAMFAILAIVIAIMGLMGLSSYTIVQRTKEIGIRKVLGASETRILSLLSKDYLKLLMIGILIGLPISIYSSTRWLDNYAYHISISWWMVVLPVLLITILTAITIFYNIFMVTRKNPVDSLRYE